MNENTPSLEDRYESTCTTLQHIEKKLETLDNELVEFCKRFQENKAFENHEIEEFDRVHKLWDALYSEKMKLKKEKFLVSAKLRSTYSADLKAAYNANLKTVSPVVLASICPVRKRSLTYLRSKFWTAILKEM
jgi:hypothetical protein